MANAFCNAARRSGRFIALELERFILPPRGSKRRFPRGVKIEMSNDAR
ncbi:hypothetical protein AKJ09_10956 [Labilithrix luteola]|uniref:Uncharacterized protein n=1 Tax=Labilithrix luteola TaxID=1391654 RepID=A0A0K1QEZ3_9BACT|nr:hypothetical protein AKJ09_10956 [Labilithrix luteola]